jgi:carbon-monoxide dehydrogenase small subunit
MLGVQANGKTLRTVEGLATNGVLHALQQAFIDHHALQCGFCTPGFLMLAVHLLETKPDATEEEIRDALSANLCRCTGYVNIIKAVRAVADSMKVEVK